MSGRAPGLAAVLAHPDDESRIVGGTLAMAAARGFPVSVYCATRGEAGDPSLHPEEVAALRERELRSACDVLGVGRLWLDAFPDGGLHHVEPDIVVERVVRFLRASRPAAVITFGPDGRTRHLDHVLIGEMAEKAFELADDGGYSAHHLDDGLDSWQPGRLYHTAVARTVAELIGWPHPALPDDQLVAVDVHAVLAQKRQAAVEAHASQWALSPLNLTGGWEAWSVEHFRVARTAGARVVEDPLEALLTERNRG